MDLNNRIYDDECLRPDPEELRVIRDLVKKNGCSVTEIKKYFNIYKPEQQ